MMRRKNKMTGLPENMKVSVVIPTYKRSDTVIDLINDLGEVDEVIVVVDEDEETKEAVERFDVKLIFNEERKGVCAARKTGLKEASGDVIIYLDDDVELTEGWLEEMLKPYEDEDVGGVCGSEVKPGDPGLIRKLWFFIRGNRTGRVGSYGEILSNFSASKGDKEEVDHMIGCNMSFRREALESIEIDTNYDRGNSFREETDLSFNVKKQGYKLIFNPKAKVYHHQEDVGGNRISDLKDWCFWEGRNTTYFFLKNLQNNWYIYLLKQSVLSMMRCIMYRSFVPIKYFFKGAKEGKRLWEEKDGKTD